LFISLYKIKIANEFDGEIPSAVEMSGTETENGNSTPAIFLGPDLL
jgi:hypothetical protein